GLPHATHCTDTRAGFASPASTAAPSSGNCCRRCDSGACGTFPRAPAASVAATAICGVRTCGAVVSCTTTSKLPVATLPAASVAVHLVDVVVAPVPLKGNTLPEAGEQLTCTAPGRLSLADTV